MGHYKRFWGTDHEDMRTSLFKRNIVLDFFIACVAADSFLLPVGAEIEQASEGACLGGTKRLRRSGRGVSKKGEGVGRKGIACNQSQTFYRTPFAHERGAIVQFHWLVARQSKYDIRNLSFMHNPTSGTQDQLKIDMAESEEVFDGVFEFSVQETSNDVLKPRSCH